MPELPEVETVKNILKTQIIGLSIKDIIVNYDKMILCDIDYFKNSLINKKITNILRKGKVLIFELEDIYLVSHLRMEGKYFLKNKDDLVTKHEHIVFKLDNGLTLRYHDTRKFGIMVVKTLEDLYNTPPLINVADEPFDIDKEDLYKKISSKKLPIKTILLDQNIMSGLGNIYVDEVLFLSCINPNTAGNLITLSQTVKIVENSINILTKAIKYGGTTIRSYTSSLGVSGNFQQFLNVHTLEDKECNICKCLIKKIKIGGRGTYYCPNCQK